uniref:Cystatin domain-containing protein n=1 Tax=Strongyloides stercoralis TaxID=6248 RepID=A0A0K0EJ27_STRER
MNSKFIGLLFFIAAFLTVLLFAKSLEPSKSSKWTPVKLTESKLIYTFARTVAKHYYDLAIGLDPKFAEVCKVLRVSQKRKKYKVDLIAYDKKCTKKASDVCWLRLEGFIIRPNKQIFTVVNITKIDKEPHEHSECHFPEFE